MGAITRLTKNLHPLPPLNAGSAAGSTPRPADATEKPTSEASGSSALQGRELTDDARLLLAAQRGNRGAFATIVERHQGAIFGYLRSRLFEASDAEDLCQEVFLRCYIGKAKFDESALVRPWLIGVARNVLREHIRKVTRRQEVIWTELCLELEAMVETDHSVYEDALGHLPDCLESLGPSARQALDLHYGSRFKLTEISERLHRSVGAVKLLMHRSRQALRHCLNRKLAKDRR
jgi:RNA polymerase sigma-70 factor (ECF subfamily)